MHQDAECRMHASTQQVDIMRRQLHLCTLRRLYQAAQVHHRNWAISLSLSLFSSWTSCLPTPCWSSSTPRTRPSLQATHTFIVCCQLKLCFSPVGCILAPQDEDSAQRLLAQSYDSVVHRCDVYAMHKAYIVLDLWCLEYSLLYSMRR